MKGQNLIIRNLLLYLEKWSSIQCTGTRPPPCSDFSLTMIDLHRVVLFGGIQKCDGGTDTYILDLPSMVNVNLTVAECQFELQ